MLELDNHLRADPQAARQFAEFYVQDRILMDNVQQFRRTAGSLPVKEWQHHAFKSSNSREIDGC